MISSNATNFRCVGYDAITGLIFIGSKIIVVKLIKVTLADARI
jgi:hypothetical protein